MKTMSWSLDVEGDNASVAAYVAGLPRPAVPGGEHGGDAQAGQANFAICSACHGADGKGNEALHAPPLAQQHGWYLLNQLRNFQSGRRGTHPGDTWGAAMRPNAMLLDAAAMQNVVAYIQTLQ
jgi:cytochrome c oxidase subunit 2